MIDKEEFGNKNLPKVKIYLHLDTYLYVRQKILDRIDKHLYDVIKSGNYDIAERGLDEMETILNYLEEFDKKFGIVDDDDSEKE